jgi:hypothetical protein
MVQHYGDRAVQQGGLPAEARYYWSDLKAMIDGIGNHPSIIQWEYEPAVSILGPVHID